LEILKEEIINETGQQEELIVKLFCCLIGCIIDILDLTRDEFETGFFMRRRSVV